MLYPDGSSSPTYVAAGSDGNLWYTDFSGSCSFPACGDLIQVTPNGTIAFNQPFPSGSQTVQLTGGPDGNLYVAVINQFTGTETIAQVEVSDPSEKWEVPVKGSINDMAPGPDGNVWFAAADNANNTGYVGFVTPGAKIKEFTLASGSGLPQGIASGSDGAVWFTLDRSNVERITATGSVKTFSIPNGLIPSQGPASGGASGVALGPDGNVWFTASDPNTSQNYAVSVTPAGAFGEYPTLTLNPEATGITAGADGNLWFDERGLGRTADCSSGFGSGVGRVTPTGVMSDFGGGCNDTNDRFNIVAGPDGNVWNAAYYGIGFNVIYTGAPFACTPLTASASASSVAPGTTETIAATIANCAATEGLMKLQSKIIRPSACGAPTSSTSHVPLQPFVQTVVSNTFTAPKCKGTYTDKLTLSSGGTVIATKSVTYKVT